MAQSALQYKILITPLEKRNVYGTEIDVTADIDISEFVTEKGIGKIKNQIDNDDYEFGIFTFSDITLNMVNYSGKFNDEFSSYSIFKFKRDLAKVKIQFINTAGSAVINFEGIINDEATRQDNVKGTVKFKVLSFSSIFRKIKVPAGVIINGVSFSSAIKTILNNPDITSLLTFDPGKITVGLDLAVDDGSKLDDRTVKNSINDLLLVSSSILFIDDTQTIIVTTRTDESEAVTHSYFAGNDVLGREDVLSIKNFNTGLHRLFNGIIVNGFLTEDSISANRNGVRQKSLTFDFITNSANFITIGNAILDDFRNPRFEMELKVRTEDSLTVKILDLVNISFTSVIMPAEDKTIFPLYGVSKYGEDNYPLVSNPLPIRNNELFRVIGIFEDPKNFTTVLKLRGTGTTI